MNSNEMNLFQHSFTITKKDRQILHNHKSHILWFTGLSGSGKSSIANSLERELYQLGQSTYILDGDNLRIGLNSDLDFSLDGRTENIRRVGEVAKLLVDSGIVVISTFISPLKSDRQRVRDIVQNNEFIEIYVKCPLEKCERRDPKGLYKRARRGEIPEFTGISSPYEEPEKSEIILETDQHTIEECVKQVLNYLQNNGYLKKINSFGGEK